MSNTQHPEALRLADTLEEHSLNPLLSPLMELATELRRQHARIAELEAQLSAIGAGGVEPLRKQAVQAAVQAEVPEAIEQMAVERYKVVPSHESMFHRWAVVAGNGTQQLYIGREVECLNMARKFTGAFLDGAFLAMQNTAPAHPAEGVPAQAVQPSDSLIEAVDAWFADNTGLGGCSDKDVAELAAIFATHPTQQGLDAETQRHATIGKAIERACMDLPDGTEISVSLEKDAGTVTLIDQDGNEYENFSCDYGFAGVLNEAIDAAMAAHAAIKKELSNEHRTNHRSN